MLSERLRPLEKQEFAITSDIKIGSLVAAAQEAQGVTVIIDVFRAFTTAAIALSNGASKIYMVDSLEAALNLRDQGICDLCMGERHGLRPESFEFGNSPSEFLNVDFKGQSIAQTTSNGTRGIVAASHATKIYAGALVTVEATVQAILHSAERARGDQITIVAMGDGYDRAVEDELCALYLRGRLLGLNPDSAAVKKSIQTMSPRMDGVTLSRADVDCCLGIDSVSSAIEVNRIDGYWVASLLRK